jgi:hypothetical protein
MLPPTKVEGTGMRIIIAALGAALGLVANPEVRARESSYLKGITAVSYKAINETETTHCNIDWNA